MALRLLQLPTDAMSRYSAKQPVTAIIVNYNCGEVLARSVSTVLKSNLVHRVVVSDNGSTDDSIRLLQRTITDDRVAILENGANLGFAAGNNVALPLATDSAYLLFLNPDCSLPPESLQSLVKALKNDESCGMAGPLILNADGTEQRGCRRQLPTPWTAMVQAFGLHHLARAFRTFNLTGSPLPSGPAPMEAISGACMLVRREALLTVGPLDPGYFLHCEDLDWCKRFALGGWRVIFVPDATAMHLQGLSSDPIKLRVEWWKHKGMIRYFRKYHSRFPEGLLLPFVVVAVLGRYFALAVTAPFRTRSHD